MSRIQVSLKGLFYPSFCNLELFSSLFVPQVNCSFLAIEIRHNGLKLLFYFRKNSKFDSNKQGFPQQWGHGDTSPPILRFFFKNPPSKVMLPMGHLPLKIGASHLKNNPPSPLKRETLFHEMIPRKSTINKNLKCS